MPRIYISTKSEAVTFQGIIFRRYPAAKQHCHRVYYSPHAGHRRNGVGALHQEVWKEAHGPIPAGKIIHHKDGNPLNNKLSNLSCVTRTEHDECHLETRSERARQAKQLGHLAAIRSMAVAWHKSEEGRAWHRKHGKKSWKGRIKSTVICSHCGQQYKTHSPSHAKFCSTRCRQRAYAADGRYAGRVRKR